MWIADFTNDNITISCNTWDRIKKSFIADLKFKPANPSKVLPIGTRISKILNKD